MIFLIISLVLFATAAFFNAVMDTLQFHFHRSVFTRLNPEFWNPSKSWRTAYVLPGTNYKVDAWHLAKSLMIIFMAVSAIILIGVDYTNIPIWAYGGLLIVYGFAWNLTFNIFYNHLLLYK